MFLLNLDSDMNFPVLVPFNPISFTISTAPFFLFSSVKITYSKNLCASSGEGYVGRPGRGLGWTSRLSVLLSGILRLLVGLGIRGIVVDL